MSSGATLSAPEPTIYDVLVAVQTGFASMEGRFDNLENRVGSVEVNVHELNQRVGNLEVGVHELNLRMGSLVNKVGDMDETLHAMSKAVDVNSVKIISHDTRIKRLELKAA